MVAKLVLFGIFPLSPMPNFKKLTYFFEMLFNFVRMIVYEFQ